MTRVLRGFGMLVGIILPRQLAAQASCLADPDTATAHAYDDKHALARTDSAGSVRNGMPYKPEHVTLVTNEADCRAALKAFNAASGGQVTQTYLLRIESSGYAMVPAEPPPRKRGFTVLNNAFQPLFSVVDLD